MAAGNANVRELERIIGKYGGKIVSMRAASKHYLVRIRTSEGVTFRVSLSKAPMPAGHVEFWLRQRFRRAKKGGA